MGANIFSRFKQSEFVKNAAILQVGNVSSTLIQGLAGIFIARLLQPELFGIYSLAFGLAGVLTIFVTIISQDSITPVLSEAYTKKDSQLLTDFISFIYKTIFIMGVLALLSFVIAPFVAKSLYQNSQIGFYTAMFVLALFLSSAFFALTRASLQIVGEIKKVTWITILDQLARSILSIGAVLIGWKVAGAVGGQLAGAVVVAIISLFIFNSIHKTEVQFPSLSKVLKVIRNIPIKKYLGFHIWVAIDRNISILYGTLSLVLVGIFISPAEVGFFKVAFSYMNIMLALLGPISVLLNVEFVKIKVEQVSNLRRNFIRVSLYSLLLSGLITLVAILISPWFFKYLYGESFLPSIKYVLGFVVYGALFGIGVALGPMWRAINKVKISILINLITLAIGVPLGLVFLREWGAMGGVVMITMWYVVSHFASFIYLSLKLKQLKAN